MNLKLPVKTKGFEAGVSHSSAKDKRIHYIFIYLHFVSIVLHPCPEDSRNNGGTLFKNIKLLLKICF